MKSYLCVALLGAVSLSACAQSNAPASAVQPGTGAGTTAASATPGTAAARAIAAVRTINPQVKIDQIGAAPLPGFQEVIVGGQVVYVSDDGKYLMQGTLYDINAKQDLGEASLARVRRDLLKTIPLGDRIVFAPAKPKYTVTVFTDVTCTYCRKFHSQIAEYNQQGIAVQYVAFPRAGLGSDVFRNMVSVWCAADPRKALTDAKLDKPVPAKNCTNPVAMQYTLGQRMGLTGTPMILADDGTQLGGYVAPAQLRAALDQLAGKTQASSPPAAAAPAADASSRAQPSPAPASGA